MDRVKEGFQFADDVADLSVKLNESAETLQRVDFAAQRLGSVTVNELATMFTKLEGKLGNLKDPEIAATMERLGLKTRDFLSLPMDQKLVALADGFQRARENGTGVYDMQKLLEEESQKLIPLLSQSGEALQEMFDRANVVSGAAIEQMARVNDEIDGWIQNGKIFAVDVLGDIVEGVQMVRDLMDGENPFEKAIDRAKESGLARMERARDRERTAAMMQERAAAAAQESEQKVTTDKATKAQAALEAARLAALPEAQRIPALEGQLQGIFARMLTGTGLEGQGKAGLQRMIEGLNTDYGRERQIPFIEALTEAEKVEREITKLKEHQAELAKKEAESKLAAIRTTALEADLVSGRRGATGAVQATIDAIFGRTSDPVLRENQSQTGLLRSIDRRLSGMQLAGAGAGGVDEFRNFP